MNGLALAAALAFAQAPDAPAAPTGLPAPEPAAAPAPPPSAVEEPPPPRKRFTPRAAEIEAEPSAAVEPAVVTTTVRRRRVPAATASEAVEPAVVTTTARRRRVPAAEPSAAVEPAAVTTTARRRRVPVADPSGVGTASSTTTSTTPTPTPTATPPRPVPEREEAERAARSFLDALARGDASALAAVASDRFSFDGDVQIGRETIRRTWRDLLAGRPPGLQPAVGALELLEAQDAATRFGKPPPRLASLVRRGVTVAIGDVGGRVVVLFLAREGGKMAVLGMHD